MKKMKQWEKCKVFKLIIINKYIKYCYIEK